ncbi:MAG: cysteine desulfurase CsdA [Rhodospirillaceae bacterium]|nr:cysteine desulfurase CsdA [Rhodospirillaceae bacterium]
MATKLENSIHGSAFDVEQIRQDFPILSEEVYGKPLVYLDNGASAQKPRAVIDAISNVYETEYANVHRGVHYMSQLATDAMEGAREKLRAFINARDVREVIFVRGATEGINLVASSWGRNNLSVGDEVILSVMEHHSNIVPWQLIAQQTGALLKVVPISENGSLDMNAYAELLSEKTKIVAITHISNALGTVTPVDEIIRIAHEKDVPVLLDGCQAAPHMALDMQALDVDFYVFSGHKIYGPSGIGVLYGKEKFLDAMPPYHGGGEMIDVVTFAKTTYADLPFKFEAGTPHISGVIGMGAAIDYINMVGLEKVAVHEDDLLEYGTAKLGGVNGLKIIGTSPQKAAILSFVMEGIHPHDVGTILDREGIAVRTGHHCAQPVMERYDLAATIRASIGMYNTREEIDLLVSGLGRVREIFGQ